jgi:hypothetical protein
MDDFAAVLAKLAPMPWRTDLEVEPGVIFDAQGRMIVVVDKDNAAPDIEAHAVARCIVHAMRVAERSLR